MQEISIREHKFKFRLGKKFYSFQSASVLCLSGRPEIEDLILHHFGRVREAFQTLELFHQLLCVNVAALAQQDIIFGELGRSA